jgi:hypothetical protein
MLQFVIVVFVLLVLFSIGIILYNEVVFFSQFYWRLKLLYAIKKNKVQFDYRYQDSVYLKWDNIIVIFWIKDDIISIHKNNECLSTGKYFTLIEFNLQEKIINIINQKWESLYNDTVTVNNVTISKNILKSRND